MQRVKVGLIGLAAVVLLIGLASAIFSAANRERPVIAAGAPAAEVVANMAITNTTLPTDTANEPLAELGVAPATSGVMKGDGAAVDVNTVAPVAPQR